jgi:hypothetical protein
MIRFCTMMLLSGILMVLPAISAGAAVDAPKRPNIVMFIADDMSIKDSSAYGNREIPGPNMAALA